MLDVRWWMLVEGRRCAPTSFVLTNIQHPTSKIQHPTSALSLPADQLRLGHLFDRILGPLASGAAQLDAAIGHLVHPVLRYLIDHKASYMDALGCVEGLVDIPRVNARLQAVIGIVNHGD